MAASDVFVECEHCKTHYAKMEAFFNHPCVVATATNNNNEG
jgi:hypothetical protein